MRRNNSSAKKVSKRNPETNTQRNYIRKTTPVSIISFLCVLLTAFFYLSESSLLASHQTVHSFGVVYCVFVLTKGTNTRLLLFFFTLMNRESEEITQQNIFFADMTKEFLNATKKNTKKNTK